MVDATPSPGPDGPANGGDLTQPERLLRRGLRYSAVGNALEILVYLLPAVIGPVKAWGLLPFVVGSSVKSTLLASVSWLGAADVRRFSSAVGILVVGYAAWAVAALFLLLGDTGTSYHLVFLDITIRAILIGGIALEGALAILFAWLWHRAMCARWNLTYLWPHEFATLGALGESLLPSPDRLLSGEQIAANVDRYLFSFQARRKVFFKLALTGLYAYPIVTGHPPFPLMSESDRADYVAKRFLRDVEEHRILKPIRNLVQEMIRLGQQQVYIGYYSDPRTFESVGYTPFSKRPGYAAAMRKVTPHGPGLVAAPPDVPDGGEVSADVVIIGSGAGGATLAYRLAESGRHVTLLERGHHVKPSTFTEDEVDMISRLYEDGALELSRNFQFQILQGMCVGGSTVVNNAVCFETPSHVLDHWNEDLGAGLDRAEVAASFARLRQRLPINRQSPQWLNKGARKFVDGVMKAGLTAQGFGIVEANIADCLGCGYCNIGCAFGKKLSMLDTVLPKGQECFGVDSLRILSQCRAEAITGDGSRASGVVCSTPTGKITVRGKTVIVAAGPINSSYLLQQSGLGGPTVGHNLCFNMGSPMTADYDERLDSYEGLQISHYLEGAPEGAFVLETWWNPVLSQALLMPGWLGDHWNNMQRYAYMTATGVLIGTETNARVTKARIGGGPDVVYDPTVKDLKKLAAGLKVAAQINLAAGATRVMPATWRFREYRCEADLRDLDVCIQRSGEMSLGTGHPQGGNRLSPGPKQGVVNADFRIHGMENVYVCDASVFPSSTTVNPQMTVMALAEYAAPRIA